MAELKRLQVSYYALLREERGLSRETIETSADTPQELYRQLQAEHGLSPSIACLKVAVNDQFEDWETQLNTADHLVFIPPVSGG